MSFEPKDLIAIYAAILSSGQLAYTIWRHKVEDSEKASKKPSISFSMQSCVLGGVSVIGSSPITDDDCYYSLTLCNVGGSDVVIVDVTANGESCNSKNLPASLAPAAKVNVALQKVTLYKKPIRVKAIANSGQFWEDVLELV